MNRSLPKLASLGTLSLAFILFLCGCASQEKKAPTDPAGQIKMGETYSVGTWKILKNDETAAEWYRKAALQGDPDGEYRLGLCYDRGLGVPKNEALAAKWFSKAAQGGNASASTNWETATGWPKESEPTFRRPTFGATSRQLRAMMMLAMPGMLSQGA